MRQNDLFKLVGMLFVGVLATACAAPTAQTTQQRKLVVTPTPAVPLTPRQRVIANAVEQTNLTTAYDPAYVALAYPNGDVLMDRGVCADVIVRALRAANVDLQKELHEDMKMAFAKYPQKWGARGTDANIDHRRVPNLMTWFARQNKSLPITEQAPKQLNDYQPGDVVAWELNASTGQLHIGLVSDTRVAGADRYAIIHNISSGAQFADVLFAWKIIGHYRYFTDEPEKPTPLRTRTDRQKIKDRR